MKKIIKSLLFVVVVTSMFMVGGCGNSTEPDVDGDDSVVNGGFHNGDRIKGMYYVMDFELNGLDTVLLWAYGYPVPDSLSILAYATPNVLFFNKNDSLIIRHYVSDSNWSVIGFHDNDSTLISSFDNTLIKFYK